VQLFLRFEAEREASHEAGVRRACSAKTVAPNEIQLDGVGGLRELSFTHIGDHTTERRNQMTRMKTLSAVIILSAAVASPVFAQDAGVRRPQPGPTHRGRAYDLWNYRRAYNQLDGPFYASPRAVGGWSNENSDSKGKDPSRVGGEDPYLHPGG
jgi:hypothetical protein